MENVLRQIKNGNSIPMLYLFGTAKTIVWGKFIAITSISRKKRKRPLINNLRLHVKELEQTKPKVIRRKKIIKIKSVKKWMRDYFESTKSKTGFWKRQIGKPSTRIIKNTKYSKEKN
jgi:hypothetical protein